jgi:hypothetical protein
MTSRVADEVSGVPSEGTFSTGAVTAGASGTLLAASAGRGGATEMDLRRCSEEITGADRRRGG